MLYNTEAGASSSSSSASVPTSAYEIFVQHLLAPTTEDTATHLAHHVPPLYLGLQPSITLDRCFDVEGFAKSPAQVQAGTTISSIGDARGRISFDSFQSASRRKDGEGKIKRKELLKEWDLYWKGEKIVVLVAQWQQKNQGWMRQTFLFSSSYATSTALHLAVSSHQSGLPYPDSVLVFADGHWNVDDDLRASVREASWDDVILDGTLKDRIKREYTNFVKSEQVYKRLGVSWKRGLILVGPPGNGKTISIKAIMKDAGVPALHVKSFNHHQGDEGGIRTIFERARQESPCLLILEDLDSLITDRNRSFFLNELDGLAEGNDGLFLIGSTNHADRLDGSLSNRPSRFDRKYFFTNPSTPERRSYALCWQRKLAVKESDVVFPDTLLDVLAGETEGFSFAYLKETFVSALLVLAGTDEHEEKAVFETVLLDQIRLLRESLNAKEQETASGKTSSSRPRSGRIQRDYDQYPTTEEEFSD